MRKLSAALLCLILLAFCCLPAAKSVSEDASGGFCFLFMPNGEGTAVINRVYGGMMDNSTNAPLQVPEKVVFPGEIDGYTVTELSLYEFRSYGGTSPMIRHVLEEAKELVIPDSVRRIDWGCFAYCDGLTSVVIPEGVEEIGDYAFYSCDKLASVTFPSTLRRIGKGAFGRCGELPAVELPEGVEEIGEDAFDHVPLNLREEKQDADTEMLDGHFRIRREGSRVVLETILETILDTSGLDTIVIPEGVTDMEIDALRGAYFKTLRIPASLTGDLQFGENDGHNVIWEVAEGNPRYSAADGILIDEEKHMAVSGWREAEKVVIPEGVEIIGDHAFYSCNLTEITLPSTLREIRAFAFADTNKLTAVSFPESLEKLHASAFIYSGFQGPLPPAVLHLDQEPDRLEMYLSYETKDGLWKYILFTDDTCAIVGYNCPEKAKGTLNIPAKLDGHPVVAVLHTCSYCYNYDALKIPEGIRLLAKYAFANETIRKVSLPKSLEEVDPDAFHNCTYLELTEEQKARFAGADPNSVPCRYHLRPDGTAQIDSWKNHKDKKIVVPETLDGHPVSAIGPHVFDGCDAETVTLPEGLKYIGYRAFYTCSKLKNITVPDSLTFIGNEAFENCQALNAFAFPSALTYVGDDAFKWTPLKEVILPEGLTFLGDRAFWNGGNGKAKGCVKAVLPGSLKHVGAYAFQFLSVLKDVTFSEGMESIGEGAFSSTGLTKVVLPSTMKTVGDGAFAYCESLQALDLCRCETVGEESFAYCPKLKTAVFGERLQTIADGAFLDHGLKEIVLPATVTKIGDAALHPMQDGSPLTITFGGNVPELSMGALLAFDVRKNKTVWPTKLTVKLPAGAEGTEEILRLTMSELGLSEKQWKLVPAE